jgi:hypothetical protein
MAAKRLAGGSTNIDTLNEFVSALIAEDTRSADAALEGIKLKDNEFGRGYRKALLGMRIALFEKNVDSLIYKTLKGGMLVKDRKDIQTEFRSRRNTPFASEHEKGFYAAWKDVLRLVDTNLKSG